MNGWIFEVANKAKLFRSSMNGFNKEDVNRYIIEMNNEFASKDEESKGEITSLKEKLAISAERLNEASVAVSERDALCEKLQLALAENEKLSAELEEKTKQANEINTELAKKEAELTAAAGTLAEKEKELLSVSSELETLRSYIADLQSSLITPEANSPCNENDDTAEKLRLYDELRGNIGDILLKANKNADDIVKEAEKKADDISRDSKEKADSAKRRLAVVAGRTIAIMKKKAILNADNCVKELKAYSDDVAHTSRAMTASLEKKYSELSTKMEAYSYELEEGIKAALREFDKGCNNIKSGLNTETDK